MNFLNHPEKLPEKIEQAELVAYGYKWGRKNGFSTIARQLRASIVIQERIMKLILEQTTLSPNAAKKGEE